MSDTIVRRTAAHVVPVEARAGARELREEAGLVVDAAVADERLSGSVPAAVGHVSRP